MAVNRKRGLSESVMRQIGREQQASEDTRKAVKDAENAALKPLADAMLAALLRGDVEEAKRINASLEK